MHFFAALTAVLPAFVAAVSASPAPITRAEVEVVSSIVTPADGASIQAGETFSFQFTLDNWCESGYTPISLYLLADAPTASSLDASGQYSEFIYHFGDYEYSNFGKSQSIWSEGVEILTSLVRPATHIHPCATSDVYHASIGRFLRWPDNLFRFRPDGKRLPRKFMWLEIK